VTDTITVPDFTPNTLVQYKGGGYGGCFWEWNYAYISPDGEFFNLGCTGSAGCETLEKLEGYYQRRRNGDFYLSDLAEKSSLTEIPDEIPVDHLMGVADKLKEIGHYVDFQPRCDECEIRFSIELAMADDLHGDGGVHMSNRKIICSACRESYTCCDCGEYVGSDGMTKGSRSCKYCDDKECNDAN
jgi:hypothetical protein